MPKMAKCSWNISILETQFVVRRVVSVERQRHSAGSVLWWVPEALVGAYGCECSQDSMELGKCRRASAVRGCPSAGPILQGLWEPADLNMFVFLLFAKCSWPVFCCGVFDFTHLVSFSFNCPFYVSFLETRNLLVTDLSEGVLPVHFCILKSWNKLAQSVGVYQDREGRLSFPLAILCDWHGSALWVTPDLPHHIDWASGASKGCFSAREALSELIPCCSCPSWA